MGTSDGQHSGNNMRYHSRAQVRVTDILYVGYAQLACYYYPAVPGNKMLVRSRPKAHKWQPAMNVTYLSFHYEYSTVTVRYYLSGCSRLRWHPKRLYSTYSIEPNPICGISVVGYTAQLVIQQQWHGNMHGSTCVCTLYLSRLGHIGLSLSSPRPLFSLVCFPATMITEKEDSQYTHLWRVRRRRAECSILMGKEKHKYLAFSTRLLW